MNNISQKEKISQELKRRGINPEVISSRKSLLEQELKRRGLSIPQKEPSFGESALTLGKGALSGLVGGTLDTAALIYNLPAMLQNFQSGKMQEFQQKHPELAQKFAQREGISIEAPQELPIIPSATEAIEEQLGISEIPEELKHLYEGAQFAGSLAGIGGIGRGATQLGLKGIEKVGKTLGTVKPAELGGALATGTIMSKAEEDLGALGGLGAGAVTGALTTKGLSQLGKGIKEFGKGLKGTLTGKGETLGDMTIGRALAIKGEPSLSIMNTAKEYGIQLPFNIPLKSPVADFLANTALNSLFTTKEYKNIIEKSPQQLKNRFLNIIDEIHPEKIGKTASSQEYYSALKAEEEATELKAKELYNFSKNFLKKEDRVSPSHTISALKSLKEDLSAPVPSEPMKFVINRIGQLSKAWDLIPPSLNISKEFSEDTPHLYEKLSEAFRKKAKPIPVESLIQQRQAFMHDLRNKDAKGVHNQLKRIIKALDEDISNVNNKEFLNHWRAANSYFKNEIAGRVRSDLSRSMLEGTFPKEAFNYMTSPGKINELKRILGSSSNANQIMNSLKRSKLQQILVDPSISAEGTMNMATFSNKFMKNSKDYDLLKSLLGEKSFNDLNKLAEISQAYSAAGKSFANPSGTTVRLQDLARIGAIGGVIFSGGTGILPTTASIVTPLVLSKLLSNPRYTDAAFKYALSAKKGDLKNIKNYQNSMKNIFYETLKRQIPYQLNKENSKKE